MAFSISVPPQVKAMAKNKTFDVTIDFPDLIFDEDLDQWERNAERELTQATVLVKEVQELELRAIQATRPGGFFQPGGGLYQLGEPVPFQNNQPPGEPEYVKGYVMTREQARRLNELQTQAREARTIEQKANVAEKIRAELEVEMMMRKSMEKMRRSLEFDSAGWTGLRDSA